MRVWALVAVLAVASAAQARPRRWSAADRADFPRPARPSADVLRLRLEGDKMLGRATSRENVPLTRRDAARYAASFYQAALKLDPTQSDLWFALGVSRYYGDQWDEAVSALDHLRALDPGYPRRDVAFFLAIALAKLGRDFDRIIDEYLLWLRQSEELVAMPLMRQLGLGTQTRSQVYGNLGESYMAVGRLDEAVASYKQAEQLSGGEPLNLYGLAVALDRDGNATDARRAMNRALAVDPQMDALEREGVFFVPPGDVNYYYALGFETRGQKSAAIEHWKRFLRLVPDSRFAERAREHLAGLGAR